MKYAWIKEHVEEYPRALMCRVLKVSRSGYYGWIRHTPSPQEKKREVITEAAQSFYARSHNIYGYRKVYEDIEKETEIDCCEETVRKIMHERKLFSMVTPKFVRTTDSDHDFPVAKNILNRNFNADRPNQRWVGDITYIRTREGWLYLATVMDLFSRKIVGWSMSKNIDADLVCSAIGMAITHRCPGVDLVHHSDRGVQYASEKFQNILGSREINCSMSRKGDCWDNAPQESFYGKLKREWIRGRIYRTHNEARQDVFYYIEMFYNCQRRHASLGYVSPVEFERLNQMVKAA